MKSPRNIAFRLGMAPASAAPAVAQLGKERLELVRVPVNIANDVVTHDSSSGERAESNRHVDEEHNPGVTWCVTEA